MMPEAEPIPNPTPPVIPTPEPGPSPAQTQTWRNRTITIVVAVVVLLAGYDALAYTQGGQDATITQVVRDNNAEWPMIGVGIGVVIGHIFWGSIKSYFKGVSK